MTSFRNRKEKKTSTRLDVMYWDSDLLTGVVSCLIDSPFPHYLSWNQYKPGKERTLRLKDFWVLYQRFWIHQSVSTNYYRHDLKSTAWLFVPIPRQLSPKGFIVIECITDNSEGFETIHFTQEYNLILFKGLREVICSGENLRRHFVPKFLESQWIIDVHNAFIHGNIVSETFKERKLSQISIRIIQ